MEKYTCKCGCKKFDYLDFQEAVRPKELEGIGGTYGFDVATCANCGLTVRISKEYLVSGKAS